MEPIAPSAATARNSTEGPGCSRRTAWVVLATSRPNFVRSDCRSSASR